MTGTSAYDLLFQHAFTRLDPERAHHLAFSAIRAGGPLWGAVRRALSRAALPEQPVEALGLTFRHPLGLAAGFDKCATGIDALAALGFSHIEIGTVTGRPQPGNPKPRLFRLPADQAIINRMGFNNDGAQVVARRLALRERALSGDDPALSRRVGRTFTPGRVHFHAGSTGAGSTIVGVNIGKSKVVPDEDQAAVEADYRLSTRLLAPYADYLVVNVSSPNTPGLRNLQAVEKLAPLLEAVREQADQVRENAIDPAKRERRVPLLVKIAPDLSDDDVVAVADMALAIGLDGIIATNTTIARTGLSADPHQVDEIGAGGLSGQPLTERSVAVIAMLRARVGPDFTLIGVGGIGTVEQARARLAAGATLLQAYTGFIYGGPAWPHQIASGLAATPLWAT